MAITEWSLDGRDVDHRHGRHVPIDAGPTRLSTTRPTHAGNVEGTKSVQFAVLERYDDSDETDPFWTGLVVHRHSITAVYGGSYSYAQFNPATVDYVCSPAPGSTLIAVHASKLRHRPGHPRRRHRAIASTCTGASRTLSERELLEHASLPTRTHTVERMARRIETTSGSAANVSIDAIDVVGTLVADTTPRRHH